MNYFCNIIVPSLLLLLRQFFTLADSIFLSNIVQSGDWTVLSIFCFTYFVRIVCSCVANSKVSVSNFISAFLSQFHVPFSSVVSSISLTNWPYILLLFHSSFFSLIQLCLNYLLSTASLYSIVSATFTPSINGSIEFLTYHAKLLSSIVTLLSHFPTKTYPINITFRCHGLSQTFWSICLNFLIHLYSISGFLHLISLQKPPKY